jgi:hypothetical protein
MQMILTESELLQFILQRMIIDAQIQQRADKHVAADSGKNVEIKSFHRAPLLSATI